jgi:hypothetical protein
MVMSSTRGPNGDPAAILDRALTLLVADLEKRKINDAGILSLAFFSDPDGNPLYLAEMSKVTP